MTKKLIYTSDMSQSFIAVFLFVIFLLEGLGIKGGREVAFYLILSFPAGYTLLSFFKGQTLKGSDLLDPWEGKILIALSFFTVLSVFFSANKQVSFEQLLLFFALVFTYLVGKQIPKEKEITFIKMITVITIIFSGFWGLIVCFGLFLPASGYNFVFPTYYGHNQLGDFLIIPVTMIIFKMMKQERQEKGNGSRNALRLLGTTILLLLLLLSTSRSAFLAVGMISLILMIVTKQKLKIAILTIAIFFLLFIAGILVTTSVTQKYFGHENTIVNRFVETFNIPYKSVLSDRDKLAQYIVQSTTERGLFGIGAGNFRIITSRFSVNPFQWVDSSHNILGDILAENGIFTLLASIAFGIYILRGIIKYPTMWGFVLIAIFINSQTNFLHRFYAIQFLGALLMGMVAQDNNNSETPPRLPCFAKQCGQALSSPNRGGQEKIVYGLPFVLLICAHLMITSHFLIIKGNYGLAFITYPLNIEVHERKPTSFSEYLFPGVSSLQRKIRTTAALERAYYYHPFEGVTLYKDLYRSYLSNDQRLKAKDFVNQHLQRVSKIIMPWYPSSTVINDAAEFCAELYDNKCPYEFNIRYWTIRKPRA